MPSRPLAILNHAGAVERRHDGGDEHQLQHDAGDGVEEGAGPKHLQRQRRTAHPQQHRLHAAPDGAARQHGGKEGGIDRRRAPARRTGVNHPADQSVDRQLAGHRDGGGEQGRHTEHHTAQQRGHQPHRHPPGPAADQPAEKHREVHGQQQIADAGDLTRDHRQNQAKGQEESGERQFFGVCFHRFSSFLI